MNKDSFINELNKLGIEVTHERQVKLEKYYQILQEENKKYNLTRIINKNDVYLKHFYDSLTISKIIKLDHQKICDLGTGAGFPGIVLKIFYPNIKLVLVESNRKKCKFLNLIISELSLSNVQVINERIEDYGRNHRELYDIVVARALAPIHHLLEFSSPILKINGKLLMMKANLNNELFDYDKYLEKLMMKKIQEEEFYLPVEDSKRLLLLYQKIGKTSSNYPRRYSEIKKNKI